MCPNLAASGHSVLSAAKETELECKRSSQMTCAFILLRIYEIAGEEELLLDAEG